MDMAGEVMDDTLDDALDGADAEDETNDVVNQARPCTTHHVWCMPGLLLSILQVMA